VKSSLGKELDSLSDIVSFGVLPALILFNLFQVPNDGDFLKYSALLIAAAAAIRLAKFNIDDRQSKGFIGLPTPANAIVISSLPFLVNIESWSLLFNPLALAVISISLSFLMVSNIRFISLKFQGYEIAANWEKYLLLVSSLILVIIFQTSSIPIIFVIYFLISVIKKGSPNQ